jgi:two-component sensor histidine kinase
MGRVTMAGREYGAPRDFLLSVTGLGWQFALALGLTVLAAGGRVLLGQIDPEVVPAGLYYPAIVMASLIGGWRAGTMALALCFLANLGPFGRIFAAHSAGRPINIALFVVVSALGVAVSDRMGTLVGRLRESRERLAERNLHYDTLFSTTTEGFAICEAIRDASGEMVDYRVVEMNPSLMRLLGIGPERLGGKMSDTPGDWTAWLAFCARALASGETASFEARWSSDHWYEVRVSPLTPDLMAQIFVDITARKTEQARQADLFDELNHRVKNNLGLVSSVLSMQAREADPAVADALRNAVARVHSIGDLHASLSKAHRTEDVDAGLYLSELGVNLSKSLLADDRVRILVDAPSAVMSTDHALALGLVVSELVTNAVKYAYPPGQSGEIRVTLTSSADGAVLVIADDGRGLDPDAPPTEGLGMRLVHSMVAQVGGSIGVDETHARGARFVIRLPAASASAQAAA